MNTMTCPCVSLGIWTLDFMLAILNLRDSKCVGTIRTNFPKSVQFLHSVRMALSHAFHVRKLHTKQVISHPKGRTERCWGHGHSPQAPGLISLSGSMGPLPAFSSGAGCAFWACSLHLHGRKCPSPCLLTGHSHKGK